MALNMFSHRGGNGMKKRRYVDLYGYTSDEFDRLLERGLNKKLRSAGKSRSELDMHTVFAAYEDETRKLSRRRLHEMRITA
jgi:superfamily II DNA/RNA helicase